MSSFSMSKTPTEMAKVMKKQRDTRRKNTLMDLSMGPSQMHEFMSEHNRRAAAGGSYFSDSMRGEPMRGGAWNPLKAAYNEVANPDSLLRSRYVPAVANEIVGNQLGANLGSAAAASVTGAFVREGYTSSAASWLNAHGSEPVSTLRVMRAPVSKGLNTLLQAMSLGQWDRAKKLAESDDVFHLVLIINGRFATEKRATITFTSDVRPPSNAEFMDVTLHGQMSIDAMMQKTLDAMGKSKYFRYDAFSNNCQDFILAILEANGLMTPELRAFIRQPAEVLAKNTPGFLPDAARAATNIGAMLGMGKGKAKKSTKLSKGGGAISGGGPISLIKKGWNEVTNKESVLHQMIGNTNHVDASDRDSFTPIPLEVYKKAAEQAYATQPSSIGAGWELLNETPTLKLWRKGDEMLVGVRGTVPTDPPDVAADAKIAANLLDGTTRAQRDIKTMQEWKAEYPGDQYTWYAAGHSLGGAMMDVLIAKGFVKGGVSYNPAVEPKNFKKPLGNFRIYASGDALYNSMGRFVTGDPVQVRNVKSSGLINYLSPAAKALDQHNLGHFEGGAGGSGGGRRFYERVENEIVNPDSLFRKHVMPLAGFYSQYFDF